MKNNDPTNLKKSFYIFKPLNRKNNQKIYLNKNRVNKLKNYWII